MEMIAAIKESNTTWNDMLMHFECDARTDGQCITQHAWRRKNHERAKLMMAERRFPAWPRDQ